VFQFYFSVNLYDPTIIITIPCELPIHAKAMNVFYAPLYKQGYVCFPKLTIEPQ